MPPTFLPLLASLLGNDFVDSEVLASFEHALEQIQPSPVTSSRITSKVKSICCFLQNATNVNDALQSVLSIVPDESQKICLKKALVESMAAYDISTETLASYFERGEVANSNPDVPDYVVQRHREGYFPSKYLGVIFSRRQILEFQIEDVQKESASRCSRKLRQVIYRIINREDVREWERIGSDNVQKSVVKASDRPVKGFDSFPKLESLQEQTDEVQRRRFLKLILESEKSIHSLPENSQVFVMSIRYWISHAKPRVKERWVQTLILQYLHPSSMSHTDEARFDLYLQHGLSQWQSVMAEALFLNEILLNAFPEPDMSRLFNGAASQRIMHELSNGKSLEHYGIPLDEFQELYSAATDKLVHKLESSECTAGEQKLKETNKRLKKKVDMATNCFAELELSSDDD